MMYSYKPHLEQQRAAHWQIVEYMSYLNVVWETATSGTWNQAVLSRLVTTAANLEDEALAYGCPALADALGLLRARLAAVRAAPDSAQCRAIGGALQLANRMAQTGCPVDRHQIPAPPLPAECPAGCAALHKRGLFHLDEILSGAQTFDQIAAALFAYSEATFGASGLLLHLVADGGGELECVARFGMAEPLPQGLARPPLDDEGPFSDAARSHSTVVLASFRGLTGAYRELAARARAAGHEAMVAVPLACEDQILGVVSLLFASAGHGHADPGLLQLMARQGAAALAHGPAQILALA